MNLAIFTVKLSTPKHFPNRVSEIENLLLQLEKIYGTRLSDWNTLITKNSCMLSFSMVFRGQTVFWATSSEPVSSHGALSAGPPLYLECNKYFNSSNKLFTYTCIFLALFSVYFTLLCGEKLIAVVVCSWDYILHSWVAPSVPDGHRNYILRGT